MMKLYKPVDVDVCFETESRASWKMAGRTVRGTDYIYRVHDYNFDRLNAWSMVIRVPINRKEDIVVQPLSAPGKKVWAGIERRSIVFVMCTKIGYRGRMYCKVNLSDPSQRKTKVGFRRGERGVLPKWFAYFHSRMKLKDTVTTTRGTDGYSQVVVMASNDHARMIRLFFALKIWVLEEGLMYE
jgi:hypothetical protein